MCGIAATYHYRSHSPASREEMQRVLDRMQRRGPDGEGQWYSRDETVALGHRRLAIIDLSDNGAQPMRTADGSKVIVFNGEIYNHQALRRNLEDRGHRFVSTSDTEVLLHLYAEFGEAMLGKLRGMFAFAIWDETKRALFLARDPFGIKPLYYSDDGHSFRAASQVKALLAGGHIDRTPEPAGHVGFFLWGHLPDPYTLYRGIRALPAGAFLWVDGNGPRKVTTYCSIPDLLAKAERTQLSSAPETLRSAMSDTVKHHLIADVPVGVFLSSGLDSTTLAALAAEAGGTLRTVTLAFEEFRGTARDEAPLAEEVARQYGAQHQTVWVTQRDFRAEFERLLDAMDQPGTDGVNTYFVSRAAASAGLKVALSGVGGDELFGGYPSFREIPRSVRALRPFRALRPLARGLRAVSAPILRRFTSPKYAGLLEYGGSWSGAYLLRRGMFMPWELPSVLDPDLAREGWRELATMARLEETEAPLNSPFFKVSALELSWYLRNQLLRDTDWASMDHSLEIRTPFVDVTLFEKVAPLFNSPDRPDKRRMADTPQRKLPDAILNRRKTGFSVPVRDWLMQGNPQPAERSLRGWARTIYGRFTGSNSAEVSDRSVPSSVTPVAAVPFS